MLYYGVVERWMNFDFSKKIYKNSSENGDMSNKKEGLKLLA
jgi:hypothetical protein